MPERNKAEDHENPLTTEQRVEVLEQRVGKNRIVLMSVALFLIITISISITVFLIQYMGEGSGSSSQALVEMQERIDEQAELITIYEGRLAQTNTHFTLLEHRVKNNSNATIQQVLIEQEQAKQAFMTSVRSAIYDLAHMVPGSRSWFELYSEQIDTAITASEAREKKLEALSSDTEFKSDDSFF